MTKTKAGPQKRWPRGAGDISLAARTNQNALIQHSRLDASKQLKGLTKPVGAGTSVEILWPIFGWPHFTRDDLRRNNARKGFKGHRLTTCGL